MKRFRTPLLLMIGGFAAKGVAVVVYRLFRPPGLLTLLTTYDPLGFHFANAFLSLFNLRGIAPTAAPPLFEVLLMVGFAVQCFLLGLAISEGRRLLQRRVASTPARSG